VPESAHVAELGVTALVHIKLKDFVPSGWSEAIQSLDFHDYRYPSALHIERGRFVPQAPAALNECLVMFAHLPPTIVVLFVTSASWVAKAMGSTCSSTSAGI
jgi:hypothetical protein